MNEVPQGRRTVELTVPATAGNLGPGFDCLGLALDLRNRMSLRVAPEAPRGAVQLALRGPEAASMDEGAGEFLERVLAAFAARIEVEPPGIALTVDVHIPPRRGLGSSAAAIVGLLAGLNQLYDEPLASPELVQLATDLEGHPDQVVPALFGGLAITTLDEAGRVDYLCLPAPEADFALVIPERHVATEEARAVLPAAVPLADAVHNAARVAMLMVALSGTQTGPASTIGPHRLLAAAFEDRLHEPYRAVLNPGYLEARTAALEAGAAGVFLSGSGPTTAAVVAREGRRRASRALHVGHAMQQAFATVGLASKIVLTSAAPRGTTIATIP